MNRCAEIRQVIPDAARAKFQREIIAALPHYTPQQIRESVGQMFREGIVKRTGNRSDGYRYYTCRTTKLKAYETEEARRAGKKITDARAHRNRARPLEEWRAAQKARAIATAERKQQHRAAIRQQIALDRAATIAAVAAKAQSAKSQPRQKPVATRPPKPPKPAGMTIVPKIAPPVKHVHMPPETVAQWTARTGQHPQQVGPLDAAQPLRYDHSDSSIPVAHRRKVAA